MDLHPRRYFGVFPLTFDSALLTTKTGLVTFVVAITAYFVMQDYPATAKFLSEPERKEVQRRLVHDRSSLADEFDMQYFWHAVKDWKVVLVSLLSCYQGILISLDLGPHVHHDRMLHSTLFNLPFPSHNR